MGTEGLLPWVQEPCCPVMDLVLTQMNLLHISVPYLLTF